MDINFRIIPTISVCDMYKQQKVGYKTICTEWYQFCKVKIFTYMSKKDQKDKYHNVNSSYLHDIGFEKYTDISVREK